MSAPQVENGYTRIANELLDAIVRYPFTRREYAILMLIIRMTYGYNKKEDAISFWQIAEITGINRSDVSKSIADLVAKNVIIKTENGRFSHGQSIPFLAVNKHYKQWVTVIKTPTVNTVGELPTVTVGESITVGETPPSVNHLSTVGELPTVTVGESPQEPSVKHHTHKDIKNNKDITKDREQQPSATDLLQEACKATWLAYKSEFFSRYGTNPVRNPKVNSQIKSFVGRIGYEESPLVAAYYVKSNENFYVKKFHSVGQMLADAEKVRTEWATGRTSSALSLESTRKQTTQAAKERLFGRQVETEVHDAAA
jgi:phage replication O-like protein O